jgi:hypothetical protein
LVWASWLGTAWGFFWGARSLTKILQMDAKIAETLVAPEAVLFMKEVGFLSVIFEGDTAQIILEINSDPPYLSRFGHLLEIIYIGRQNLRTCNFVFAYREANSAPHCLAKEAASTTIDLRWLDNTPTSISSIVVKETVRP